MHVDGFRFDLAATLAREFYEVDRLSTFFEVVQQDPVVSQVKLIAEPWDVGPGGYQVGNFPPLWTEWNGKYRDTVRDFWRGEPATLAEFASADHRLRRPLPGRRPPPVPQHQLRHLPRRVHAQRPGVVQRQAQRGQRRGEPGRREPQPVLELRRRGADRRRRRARPAGPAAAQLPGHADALPGRADDRRTATSWAAPSAATTTRTARTTSSPGSTGTTPTTELLDFVRAADRVPRPAPGVPPPPVLHRPAGAPAPPGTPLPDLAWFTPGRAGDDRRRLGQRLRPLRSRCSSTARASASAASTASGTTTTRSCSASTPTTRRSTSPCRRPSTAQKWER